jgi:alpha-mannosidase
MLLPHNGSWKEARTVKLSEELNSKPIVFVEYPHKGTLPQCWSLMNVNRDNVIVSVLKKHEDSENLVMRCYETNGEETEARISLPAISRRLRIRFKPFEIKTLLIPMATGRVKELNMLEFSSRK